MPRSRVLVKTSKETRARLRELLGLASPGPWKIGEHAMNRAEITGPLPPDTSPPWTPFKIFDEGGHTEDDAALIAESRNALEDLLDDLDELERSSPSVFDLIKERKDSE